MRKVIFSFVILVVSVLSASAQLSFYPIEEVRQLSETQFMVRSGSQTLRVNPDIYSKVKSNINDYLLVTYRDSKQSAITVAKKSNIQYRVLGVDSVGINRNGLAMVFLSSGKVYESANEAWLTVRPGQKVAGAFVDGETKVITRRWHTVPRETAITTAIPISPAPTTPVIILDEENKVMRAAAPAVSAPVVTRTAAPAAAPTNVNLNSDDLDDDEEGLMTEYPKREAAAAAAAEAARQAAAEEAARKAAAEAARKAAAEAAAEAAREAAARQAAAATPTTTSQPKTIRLVKTSK